MAVMDASLGGGLSTTSSDEDDDSSSTSSSSSSTNVTPTGALNPFNYNVSGGEVQETTLGGNTIADVADDIDYEDTSVDEQASTQDEPESTEDIIDAAASDDSNPAFDSLEDVDLAGIGLGDVSNRQLAIGAIAIVAVGVMWERDR